MQNFAGTKRKLLLLPLFALCAFAEKAAPLELIYFARLHRETRIRRVQDMDSRDWLGLVPKDARVEVYEYGEEWSLCGYEGDVGWLPTDRLYEMWRASDTPLPGFVPMYGLAIMTEESFVTVEGYAGNALRPGNAVVVADASGTVPMNRDTARLPEGSFRCESFVPWQDSQPGEELSFNAVCGPYEKSSGYLNAPNISPDGVLTCIVRRGGE